MEVHAFTQRFYTIKLFKGEEYIARYMYGLEFMILPLRVQYSLGWLDKVYVYKTAKERVQEQMEERALRLILQKLIDESFIP